jgi:transcriptional regulator with XRE-family HTH domain
MVRRRRDALGMKQQEVGALLNPPMTRASIANIEAGKQRVLAHTLVELANILKVTVDELAHGTDVAGAELEAELQQATGFDAKTAKALAEKILTPNRRRNSA